MIKEFKEFIMRGSVLDLAVGVVIGSAFTAIVTQVVEGLITPLISLIFVLTTGKKSADDALGALVYKVEGVEFNIGSVISALITFLITAFVLFLIVKAANKMKNRGKKEEAAEEVVPTSEDYLKEIRDLLAAQTPPAETVKIDSTFTEK
ncbi:large conductance mechanosensitive channel protein MscL [Enterococcus faecalis]|uniref:large conductance mechanosensitive channel protein MscL n=1 Tax=Enterococcus faecalis TaxID=1351 RepID=UPI0001B2BD1C|nr:large conductance mechanosensitive channel protein MscL [Enterococcus faecalis]EEU70118.1 large-conductance mechanosensitive channel [Enterococcus faecalis HIP11704]EFM78708.1 large conductance mechanosensitive channel protein [Enterococcus faecalis TX0855]EGO8588503.1 large conductance mechanosensitive channel protein MscL [Enterococcus faecalis]EKK0946220.1 large conductance mechanosensitive channel protein MscL [Enterococcus faecalis]EOJ47046.1 large-conductance mechanosensitive channel 